jgi:excinuclease UvrABC ATPase subunit
MKLLECYFCDGLGFVHYYDAVDVLEDGLFIEDGAVFMMSEDSFMYSTEELLCPDCLGRGWESPWKNR